MSDIANLVEAGTGLLWPVVVAVLLWRFHPLIRQVAESRAFSLKVGQFEFTAQEVSDRILESTAEIQQELAALGAELERVRESGGVAHSDAPAPRCTGERMGSRLRKLLWVDDFPSRAAYEVEQLRALGVTVDEATSTREALQALSDHGYDAVVSSMGRSEDGSYRPTAGVSLLHAVQELSAAPPVYAYARHLPTEVVSAVVQAGGTVASTSAELFRLLDGWSRVGAE